MAYYGECLKSFIRGEHRKALRIAETFLREAEVEGRPAEVGVARRVIGFVRLQLGDLPAARSALEQTLTEFVRERDGETLFRFGNDTEVSASNFLAIAEWHLGEIASARKHIERSTRLAAELGHASAIASALCFRTILESRRGDIRATEIAAESLRSFTEEHNLKTYFDVAHIYTNWALGRRNDPAAGALGLRRALESISDWAIGAGRRRFTGCLPSLRPTVGDFGRRAGADRPGTGNGEGNGRAFHRPISLSAPRRVAAAARPALMARAEEAFKDATTIATRQGALSYRLLAALSLAKLYQATGRIDEADAVLRPALGGLSPTAEMSEITDAQSFMATLGAAGNRPSENDRGI